MLQHGVKQSWKKKVHWLQRWGLLAHLLELLKT